MVGESSMKILVIYVVVEPALHHSVNEVNRMPTGCDGHGHRSGVGSHTVPSQEIYDTMNGSQPTAEFSTPLTQDFVEPDQNVVGGVSDDDSDAGSPERAELEEEEAAEEVDADYVEEDDEVQEHIN
jgi:hypothetical protein